MTLSTRTVVAAALLLLPCPALPGAAAEALVAVTARSGVTQKFILLGPEKPVAAAILFAGGHGALNLSGGGDAPEIGWGKNNFLVRTRADFAAHGLTVALVDAPSDRQGGQGMLGGFRASAEHCQDIEAVVRHLKTRTALPVWLIGTSRGTESAANCAVRLKDAVAGLVLTSAITHGDAKGMAVTGMDLGAVRVPVFVLAHRDDGCDHTPATDAPKLLERFTGASRKALEVLQGGDPPKSKPCEALSPHGFLGLERQAVAAILTFIKTERSAAGR